MLFRSQNLHAAFEKVDAVVLATEWKEYRELDPKTVSGLVRNNLIIDGRNVLNISNWQAAGFKVLALGKTVQGN